MTIAKFDGDETQFLCHINQLNNLCLLSVYLYLNIHHRILLTWYCKQSWQVTNTTNQRKLYILILVFLFILFDIAIYKMNAIEILALLDM